VCVCVEGNSPSSIPLEDLKEIRNAFFVHRPRCHLLFIFALLFIFGEHCYSWNDVARLFGASRNVQCSLFSNVVNFLLTF
jgi:hypothetical protein